MQRLVSPACCLAAAIVAWSAHLPTATAEESVAPPKAPALTDPTILLVGDAAVRDALHFTSEQRTAVEQLLATHRHALLAIRDVGPTGGDETVRPAIAEIRAELKKLLNDEQKLRLQGLILQAQGYDALLRKDIAAQLKLTAEQQSKLAEIAAKFRSDALALRESAGAKADGDIQKHLTELQSTRLKSILTVLDAEQETAYSKLLGEQFDFSKVKPSPAAAPEFASIEEWINSDPLTMESLRGQVVVVHFFAFGCINCIHNYPWYREWHDAYQGKGVTIIGIHTPETKAETDNAQLRASMAKRELKFPVAVDKEKAMWKAWSNNIWPAVYIIDKQGRLRYWWYGELDWKGAGNQKLARQQIEMLLKEEMQDNHEGTKDTKEEKSSKPEPRR